MVLVPSYSGLLYYNANDLHRAKAADLRSDIGVINILLQLLVHIASPPGLEFSNVLAHHDF